MRMCADANPSRWFLVIALLAAQFGCASTKSAKEKESYNLSPEDIPKINTLNQSVIDQSTFSHKIEELRAKAKGNVLKDTTVFRILERVDSLDNEQLVKYDRWRKAPKRWATDGSLLFGALWVGGLLITAKDDHEGWLMLGLLATWQPMLAGGFLGWLAGKNFRGREVSRKNTDELNRHISDFNEVNIKAAMLTPGIVLRRDRKCSLAELSDKAFEMKFKADTFCPDDKECLNITEKADSIYLDQLRANNSYEKSKGWFTGLLKGGFWGAFIGFGMSVAVGSNKFQSDFLPVYVLTPLGGALGIKYGEDASGSRSNARVSEKAQKEIEDLIDQYNVKVRIIPSDR